MFDIIRYLNCMDGISAPKALYKEVLDMTEKNKMTTSRRINRRFIMLAAVVVLVLAMGTAAYAAGTSIFGWGSNFELRYTDNGDGTESESILYTDSLTEPVRIEDGRMYFLVNGENTDITDVISEAEPYNYEYIDDSGIKHHWIIGKNGPEPENYGYAEFLYKDGEGWLGGYSARTNIGPNGETEQWLEISKDTLNIPW